MPVVPIVVQAELHQGVILGPGVVLTVPPFGELIILTVVVIAVVVLLAVMQVGVIVIGTPPNQIGVAAFLMLSYVAQDGQYRGIVSHDHQIFV